MNRDFIKIIDGAKAGDNSAFEDLYNMTKKSAYFIAYSITKNEQDAMDIMQDSYIKAFSNINSLRQPESFDSWLNSIVSNNSKNYIAKKKPMLFGNIAEEINNEIGEEVLVDNSNIPEEIVDNKETSKIIMEIIDGLSEDKRLIVIMYYYQDMLVKEIASTLDLPVTTVKYKLLSARQDMKKDIERLEKKGTKLYSNAPLAFISSGLAIASSSFEVPAYASVLSGVIIGETIVGASTSAVTSMAVTKSVVVAGATVKGGVLATVGGKIAAATLAVTIAGGGTAAVVTHYNANENKTTISNESVQQGYDETLENITSNMVSEGENEYYEEFEVDDEIVVKAYSYVPTVYNREILPTAYQDKKVEFNDLPNEVKLINVFRNIKFSKEDIVFSEIDGRKQGGWIKSDDGSEYPSGFYSFDENIYEYVKMRYADKMSEYKHTFKKNDNGEYYWVSTEPVE